MFGSAVRDSLSFRTFGPESVFSVTGLLQLLPPFTDFETSIALLGKPADVMPVLVARAIW